MSKCMRLSVGYSFSKTLGYALLYESMLDSVLHARDRFLKPGGLVAPSESRMQLALCDAADVRKDRIGFWEDVYGTCRDLVQISFVTGSI